MQTHGLTDDGVLMKEMISFSVFMSISTSVFSNDILNISFDCLTSHFIVNPQFLA
jgi:hypothetical protein